MKKKTRVSASEFTLTNQSDFDHHAVKEKKLHYQKRATIFMKIYCLEKKTANYASTKNKSKNHYDYHAEKEIKNEKIKSHYQIKASFFVKTIALKTKLRFMLRLRTKLKSRFTITEQSI